WNNKLEGGSGSDTLYGSGLNYDGDEGFTATDADPLDPNRTKPLSRDDNDTFVGGEGDDVFYGGKGLNVADYSGDAAAGGTGAIDVLMGDGFGTVTDGWGDTDTLNNIYSIVTGSGNDTIGVGGRYDQFYVDAGAGHDIFKGSNDSALVTPNAILFDGQGIATG